MALLFYSVPPARAAGITVTTLAASGGPGECSLRDAILAANTDSAVFACTSGSGADAITFGALSGTIVLTASLPTINADLTIDGSNNITISGNDLYQVLSVSSGKFNLNNITIQKGKGNFNGGAIINGSTGTVTISNTNFLSNTAPSAGADAGAILNSGTGATLNIWNSSFTANLSSDQGGAIHVSAGNVSITGTTFISNTARDAGGLGGAIANAGGVVTITNSSFSLNRSNSSGGAIESFSISGLRVTNSTFDDNATNNNGDGGAIDNAGITGVVTITSSSFSNNIAQGRGGAVSTFARVTISNSAFLNNQSLTTAGEGGGAIYISNNTGIAATISHSSLTSNSADIGGGVYIGLGALAITNTTISGNTANRDGGGLRTSATITLNNVTVAYNIADNDSSTTGDGGGIFRSSGTVNVKNTIIANNTDTGGQAPDCGGTLVSQGNNFLGLATGCTGLTDGVNGDHVANPTDPLLQPLSYYGGSTLVHALQAASSALNNGNNATCATIDQRGVARPVSGTCDIGAFEGIGSLLYMPLILK
jgi:hypothetical protein